jgi:membrane fusion protein (multidrug efflux system)
MHLPNKLKIVFVIVLLALITGVIAYLNRPESSANSQTTDDAYIEADFTTMAPQISGVISRVLVEDNQKVKAGDLLVTVDDRDFVVAVEATKAQVASEQANIASIQAQLVRQGSSIQQARASIVADEAAVRLATDNQARYRNLATDGAGTVQALQEADAQLSIQKAGLEKNQAGLVAARQQIDILQAELGKAKAALAQAKTAQNAAELKLSYTKIVAPIDGTIGQKAVRVGAYVNAGKSLLAIVPLEALYITANFRETQLAKIRSGQAVDIQVDAMPGVTFKGKVESLGPASGASFSAVPPHNATGNFTKIVQRLPVRISIDANQIAFAGLRVGMSVKPTIVVKG